MRKICTLLFSIIFVAASAQDINQLDRKGLKQGKWVEFHENGQIRMQGSFENGVPVGEFLYYSEAGLLKAKNIFSENGEKTFCEMYGDKGNVIAKGMYINKLKDGEWIYINDNGVTILSETYKDGVLDGLYTLYYEDGVVRFTGSYENGAMVGQWQTFDPEGNLISTDEYRESDE